MKSLPMYLLVGMTLVPSTALIAAAPPPVHAPADLSKLVADFTIPHRTFTLANGLRVIVMPDHTAPVVYVSINYDVGTAYEPVGKSGFAHLFEHLLFNGSENAPGDYIDHLRDAGVMSINGQTLFDYTNYYQSIPTGSLDRVLFLESDRMGHLLGAITPAVLDEQRGVVQNEKRNRDDRADSIGEYSSRAAIYPRGHPYGHQPIGSMTDLNAASLADVRQWFKDYYGPNNATMILAGDIDLATAKAKVETYFGDIPRGRKAIRPVAPVPVLKMPIEQTLTGPVSATSLVRIWPIPGLNDAAAPRLAAAAGLMTQLAGAPFRDRLVGKDKPFTSIYAGTDLLRDVGEFSIRGRVSDGIDPLEAGRALDAAIAEFLRGTPSVEALQRYKAAEIIPKIRSAEPLAIRAGRLLDAMTLRGSPAAYKRDMEADLALTPAGVMAAARTWLSRPAYRMVLKPGPRMTPPGDERGEVAVAAAPVAPAAETQPRPAARGPLPGIGEPRAARFPDIQHATLTNGIPVSYVPAQTIPFTQAILTFPFGAVDNRSGDKVTIGWMLNLLDEGAAGHDAQWFGEQRDLTGNRVETFQGRDSAALNISGPSPGFGRALDTAMMMLTRPTFPADRLETLRRAALNDIRSAPNNLGRLVQTAMARCLAPGSTAARLSDYSIAAEINGVTRADVQAAFDRWVRPEGAKLFIASNEPLSALLPRLNATLGQWTVSGKGPAGVPAPRVQATGTTTPRIVLIDVPTAVQATVQGGQLLAIPPGDEALATHVANLTLGAEFASRINMNLREDKHWSYGVTGSVQNDPLMSSYIVNSQVQPDKVGAAIIEIRKEVAAILSTRPVTRQEFDQNIAKLRRAAVGRYREGYDLVQAMQTLAEKGWPDDFYSKYDERLKALTLAEVNAALKAQLDPATWIWVVAGNAQAIRPQLDALGLPVDVVTPAQIVAGVCG